MKRFLIVLFFLALHFRLSAQQFSQYNTGTLYDAFENPSQKAFVPDTSRKIAFNLFFPNFNADITLSGSVQKTLQSRAFLGRYTEDLSLSGKNFNYIKGNVSAYLFMLKLYTSLEGNQEVGIFAETKSEARGAFTDASVAILADNTILANNSYTDLFNNRFNYQVYHQIGATYRTDVDDRLSFGVKLSALLGIVYNKVNIDRSVVNFDRPNDQAFLSLEGNYYASFEPGKFTKHDLLPSFRNPGASISFGTSYLTDDKTHVQFNIKDLGFIHWNKQSLVGHFNNTGVIQGLSERGVEDSVANTTSALVQSNGVARSFTSPTDARMELSASKAYWLNGSNIKYTPTVILSKELFYTGFTGAWVNHFQYNNFVATLTGTYDDMRYLSLGVQFMVKSPNAEFFIGSERIGQTANLASLALNNDPTRTINAGRYTGSNFYMGFSFKFGGVIEHRENASYIPMGDNRSFIKRFIQRITGKQD